MSATVPLRDTPLHYGLITRVLHWTIALLILWQLFSMSLRIIFGRQPWVGFFVGTHVKVGTILFLLIVLRVIWAIANRERRPAHGGGIKGGMVIFGHALLYILMLAIPSLGLLRAWGSPRPFTLFGLQIFPGQQPPVEWATGLANALHGELAWALALLILGHVVMVGVHEAMWRDGTLGRMAGRVRAATPGIGRG